MKNISAWAIRHPLPPVMLFVVLFFVFPLKFFVGTMVNRLLGASKTIRLPDGTGLWLTVTRYLTPKGDPLHERGLEPGVAVEEPEVKFGQTPPTGDPILEKAIERLSQKKAA